MHGRQRLVQTGLGGDRQPGADHQAYGAGGDRLSDTRMAHDTGHPERGQTDESQCARIIFGVGHGCDPGKQHRAQLLELSTGVVAGHLFARDDRDRTVGLAQHRHDRMRVSDRSRSVAGTAGMASMMTGSC